jgi:hypothetical protein
VCVCEREIVRKRVRMRKRESVCVRERGGEADKKERHIYFKSKV